MLKMGKKVREYKSGDFIFAKVKGYPAWPARVQRPNGKKYFVYFYGTGETANLPPNMIFDYAENKEKFLTKTVKRRDFNNGVQQIEYDFANNVPLEQVIGISTEEAADAANDTANDTATNDNADDTVADTTAADDTVADETATNITQNDTGIEDSDETGALVIDEGKPKGRKSKVEAAKTPAKEAVAKPVKEPKTPRGKAKKEDSKDDEEAKKDEELVSRSGRKIRPKRYIDEQTEDNMTLPSPAPKKRRGVSPASDKDKENQKEKTESKEKIIKHFNSVTQSELEELKEPFKTEDPEKDNILIAYLPNGQYVGIKLFQSRPASFKNESVRLQWDKQAASNAITLKMQLEKGQITAQSVLGQLVMDLNLTDEEKATLDKERETEEKKSRVQFLKTEMRLIELEAKIKTCLCLEKADTELCLKLLADLMELDVKPLMLLKHPTCLETVKRMRAYVGNTTSWDLSESAALLFSKQAHLIRVQADSLYKNMKELFTTPKGLSFWEFFSERVAQFKKVTAKLTSDELLELVHEPLEMSVPTSHTMAAAVEAANQEEQEAMEEDDQGQKKSTPAKAKKVPNNNSKTPVKRQSSRKLQQDDKEKEKQSNKPEEAEQKDNGEDKSDNPDKEKEVAEDTAPEENSIQPEAEKGEEQEQKEVEETQKEEESVSNDKEGDKSPVESEDSKGDKTEDKEKDSGEPRAKRTRESKKTEPPPRSPAKRKAKC